MIAFISFYLPDISFSVCNLYVHCDVCNKSTKHISTHNIIDFNCLLTQSQTSIKLLTYNN